MRDECALIQVLCAESIWGSLKNTSKKANQEVKFVNGVDWKDDCGVSMRLGCVKEEGHQSMLLREWFSGRPNLEFGKNGGPYER
jgi:hypothetical protein